MTTVVASDKADAFGIDRFVAAGHSSGGPYAVSCAALLANRVSGLMVVAGVSDMGWPGAWEGFIEPEASLMRLPDEQAVFARCVELFGEDASRFFDVPGVELSHDGPLCSFDAFLNKYGLEDPCLQDLAVIVRGADTDRLDLHPVCTGLLAVSLGLSHNFRDDHEQLKHGFVVYDALYSWLKHVRDERHDWNPQRRSQ